jgi:hypothetical protein
MSVLFRATDDFMASVRADLTRPHPFAHERVGFISVRAAQGLEDIVLLAQDYHPVGDTEYLNDPTVGAMMGQEALRQALEIALLNPVGLFHVHMHTLPGRLWFSQIDLREQQRYVPDFFKVRAGMPHGAIVLSPYSAAGRAWLGPDEITRIAEFNVVGARMKIIRSSNDGSTDFYA